MLSAGVKQGRTAVSRSGSEEEDSPSSPWLHSCPSPRGYRPYLEPSFLILKFANLLWSVPGSRLWRTEGPGWAFSISRTLQMLNSRQESKPRLGGRKVRQFPRGWRGRKERGLGQDLRTSHACSPPPPPRLDPTRGRPSGPPTSLATRSHSRRQPHHRHVRRACAEPSPSLAPPSKCSESFASHHLTLSLTMESVSPLSREAQTTEAPRLGMGQGGSGPSPTAAVRRRTIGLARPHGCRGNARFTGRPASLGGCSTAGSRRRAGSLIGCPFHSNPISAFQRLAVLALSLFSLFCIWLA